MRPVRMQRHYDSSETYLTAPHFDCDVDVKTLQAIIDKLQEEIEHRGKWIRWTPLLFIDTRLLPQQRD